MAAVIRAFTSWVQTELRVGFPRNPAVGWSTRKRQLAVGSTSGGKTQACLDTAKPAATMAVNEWICYIGTVAVTVAVQCWLACEQAQAQAQARERAAVRSLKGGSAVHPLLESPLCCC